jgi:carboxyl-terminal processing protease
LNSPPSSFVGVGVSVAIANGGAKVNNAFEDEPAANSGVKAGDLITEIDDVPVKGFNIGQVIDKLRGAINS